MCPLFTLLKMAKELARQEGIFCGTSGGATFSGALTVAEFAAKGSSILCLLPDTGERYLSTPLFEEIAVEMNAEELEISQSTPGFRFDLKSSYMQASSESSLFPSKIYSFPYNLLLCHHIVLLLTYSQYMAIMFYVSMLSKYKKKGIYFNVFPI